jgi:uncharacterized hydrophobic protein (TIGR00271 family)
MDQLKSKDALDRLEQKVEFTASYVILMSISGVLAAVALLTNSVPILIGPMIVAPSLPPLGLISLALHERKIQLIWKGLWIIIVGLVIATLCSILTTWLMNVTDVLPPEANLLQKPLLEERVHPGWFSVVAAFAAGVAGMMALADEKVDALVGVVAALALVPAASAGGIALLSRDPERSLGGFTLLGINVALIIITGYITLKLFKWGSKKGK